MLNSALGDLFCVTKQMHKHGRDFSSFEFWGDGFCNGKAVMEKHWLEVAFASVFSQNYCRCILPAGEAGAAGGGPQVLLQCREEAVHCTQSMVDKPKPSTRLLDASRSCCLPED
jgi:hypothetical protein